VKARAEVLRREAGPSGPLRLYRASQIKLAEVLSNGDVGRRSPTVRAYR
jgi:hypothetical protein